MRVIKNNFTHIKYIHIFIIQYHMVEYYNFFERSEVNYILLNPHNYGNVLLQSLHLGFGKNKKTIIVFIMCFLCVCLYVIEYN